MKTTHFFMRLSISILMVSLFSSIAVASSPSNENRKTINLTLQKKSNPNTGSVSHSPLHVFLDVSLDEESGLLTIDNIGGYDGEVFVISSTGTQMDYNPVIQSYFDVSNYPLGEYEIIVETNSWIATGYFDKE